MGAGIFLLGVPTTFGSWLGFYNDLVFELLLPVAVLLLALFVGWVADDDMVDELGRGTSLGGSFVTGWLWWVRVVIPIVLVVTLYLGATALWTDLAAGNYF